MNKKVLNFENVNRSADKTTSGPGTTTNAGGQHFMHLGKDVKADGSKNEVNAFDPLKEKRLSQQQAQQFVNN